MNRWWNLRIICKKSMQNKTEASIKPSTKRKSQSFSPVSECPQTNNICLLFGFDSEFSKFNWILQMY
jgi:hypothetical protein